ncbi:hypothetical protein RvY_00279-2 [Ramazzottius varieornatus]|uniref:Uncharacterized protein n=1 Tax=Ramazzottius varieornatus TaxID=947166 RepID=A0A1D1UM64_RAMVA|nr:hypothetical protein RvY_00279-2 [Ramazzottius varieornatus]
MHDGSFISIPAASAVIIAFLILSVALLYFVQLRRFVRLGRETIPALLTELERSCDLALHPPTISPEEVSPYEISFTVSPLDQLAELFSVAVRLRHHTELLLKSWIFRYRRKGLGMRRMLARIETARNRLQEAENMDDFNAIYLPEIQQQLLTLIGKIRESETKRKSQQQEESHELAEFLPSTFNFTCAIPIPDHSAHHNGSPTDTPHAETISSDRPAKWSVLRPSVLPDATANRSATKSEELKPTLSQDALLDLAPHLKHRTVALKAAVDAQGDFHAMMRAAKYDSLRRRDVVYVA